METTLTNWVGRQYGAVTTTFRQAENLFGSQKPEEKKCFKRPYCPILIMEEVATTLLYKVSGMDVPECPLDITNCREIESSGY